MSSVEQDMKQLEEAFHYGGFISFFLAIAIGTLLNKMCPRYKWDQCPPGPAVISYVGNLHQAARGNSTLQKIQKWRNVYGDVLALSLSHYQMVILSGYDTIKEACNLPQFSKRLLVKPFHHVCSAAGSASDLALTLPRNQDVLRRLRNFSIGARSEEAVVQQNIAELVQIFRKLQGQSCVPNKMLNESVVRSLAGVISAKRLCSEDPQFQSILENVGAIVSASSVSSGPSFFLATFFPNFTNSIEKAKNTVLGNCQNEQKDSLLSEEVGNTIMDAYLMDVSELQKYSEALLKDAKDIQSVGDILTLLATSSDNASNTIIWALYFLIQHPQLQERLFEEVYSVIGKSGMPTLGDLNSCPMAQAIIEEVFRVTSLAPLGYFHQSSEDIRFQDHFIPKNTLICSNIYALHTSPKIWDNPESFNPDRFLIRNPSNGQFQLNSNVVASVIPFSTTSKSSLGESLTRNVTFLYLTSLLQRFQFSSSLDDKNGLGGIQLGSDLMRSPREFNIVTRERY